MRWLLFLLLFSFSLPSLAQFSTLQGGRDHSLNMGLNIGSGKLRRTNPSAFLELGDSLSSKKGLLGPRGWKDSIQNPVFGLIIADVPSKRYWWYSDTGWAQLGAGNGIRVQDTSSANGNQPVIASTWWTNNQLLQQLAASNGNYYADGGYYITNSGDTAGFKLVTVNGQKELVVLTKDTSNAPPVNLVDELQTDAPLVKANGRLGVDTVNSGTTSLVNRGRLIQLINSAVGVTQVKTIKIYTTGSIFNSQTDFTNNAGDWSGALNLNTFGPKLVLATSTSLANSQPTFRALQSVDLPDLDAGKTVSGVFNPARLGTGTANNTTVLHGDMVWRAVSAGQTYTFNSPLTTTGTTIGIDTSKVAGAIATYGTLLQQVQGRVAANAAITAATATKITYDSKGLVTAGTTLADTDIPALDAAKIATGTFGLARLPVASSGTSSATQLVRADDSRLSDARTPTTHQHDFATAITGLASAAPNLSGNHFLVRVANGDTIASYRNRDTVRTVLRDNGIQEWYLRSGSSEIGSIRYGTPSNLAGLQFFSAGGNWRSQMRLLSGGGLVFGSTTGNGIPPDHLTLTTTGLATFSGDVVGRTFTFTPQATTGTLTNGQGLYNSTDNEYYVGKAGANHRIITMNTAGRVGIGTNSPGNALDVVGNITSSNAVNANSASGYIEIKSGTTAGAGGTITAGTQNAASLGTLKALASDFTFNGTVSDQPFLNISNSGNVGIGPTSAPTGNRLHVQGYIASNWLARFENNGTSGHNVYLGYNDGTATTTGMYITGGRTTVGGTHLNVGDNFYVMGSGAVRINNLNSGGMVVAAAGTGQLSVQAVPSNLSTEQVLNTASASITIPAGSGDHFVRLRSGASAISFPTATGNTGVVITIRNTTGSAITIAANNPINDSDANITSIAATTTIRLRSNGTNWVSYN